MWGLTDQQLLSQTFYGGLNPQFEPRENAEHCENVSLKGLKTLKNQLSNDHTLCTKNVHQNRKIQYFDQIGALSAVFTKPQSSSLVLKLKGVKTSKSKNFINTYLRYNDSDGFITYPNEWDWKEKNDIYLR